MLRSSAPVRGSVNVDVAALRPSRSRMPSSVPANRDARRDTARLRARVEHGVSATSREGQTSRKTFIDGARDAVQHDAAHARGMGAQVFQRARVPYEPPHK
jgi:hypothetical protein